MPEQPDADVTAAGDAKDGTLLTRPFGTQFAKIGGASGTGYVYRENGRGPAIPVSEAELRRFQRNNAWGMLALVAGFMAAMIGGAVLFSSLLGDRFAVAGPAAMATAILGLTVLAARWVVHAPSRALKGRAPVAPPIPARELKRRHMRTVTRADIWVPAAVCVLGSLWYGRTSVWVPAVGVPFGVLFLAAGLWNKRRWERIEAEEAAKGPPPP